jgi:uncharacterized protein (DUF427 family)
MKATWNKVVLAESDGTIVVEGVHYFPPESVRDEYLQPSATETVCKLKGTARYYTVEVNGQANPDAAWCYSDPLPAAEQIAGYIAFGKGVRVSA